MSDLVVALRLSWRSRHANVAAVLLLSMSLLVMLAAQFSARHPATVALDVGFSFIRFALPLVAILLAQELVGREFERRYSLTSFTYPRPRYRWLLGRFVAIVLLPTMLLLAMAAALAGLAAYVAAAYPQATAISLGLTYVTTLGFILVDLLVIAAFATLLAVAATTPIFPLVGSIGFLLVARSYSAVIELLRQDDSLVSKLASPEMYRGGLSILNYVLPDLGALDVRMIALYGKLQFLPPDWALRVGGALAYVLVLLALANWFLSRRDFN